MLQDLKNYALMIDKINRKRAQNDRSKFNEEIYNQKKHDVDNLLSEIEQIRETSILLHIQSSKQIKDLQANITEANIAAEKLKENVQISKKCEESRLQILREKQKLFSNVISRDRFIYF